RPPGDWARAEAPPAERAGLVVGRKGLLYKEPATRLALCAVHRALGLPPGRRPDRPVAPRTSPATWWPARSPCGSGSAART
ncbi:MAG TPA: hypothetical protein VFR67_21795, partial [Pilimelia sp.]|nr:hypothetical protein [Pilimelia sp.]